MLFLVVYAIIELNSDNMIYFLKRRVDMEQIINQISTINILNHLWLTFIILITMVLISRSVVAGTRYSSILIIVIFGLAMGFILVQSGTDNPGLDGFPIVGLISKTTIIALIVSFFVGGQELKKILFKQDWNLDDIVVQSEDEVVLGTKRTQFVYLVRAFFLLLGIEAVSRVLLKTSSADELSNSYILIGYIGIVVSIILIDHKAKINNKQAYIGKGIIEMAVILTVLILSYNISVLIKPIIGLPQIFFAMILSASLGMIFSNWRFGPTVRALLFAGVPVVLAGNFLIGGSRIGEAFKISGMTSVIVYGFFGQMFWMFSGIILLILLGKANHVRNLAPGMAGALSHAGLTGACTAGDLGNEAASRAPIMINVPFFGHIFVFSILAASAAKGWLLIQWTIPIIIIGLALTIISIRKLSMANGNFTKEVTGLMQFCFGWQLTAVFGSFTLLSVLGMPLGNVSMATSSALSHFGLFAAVQNGMFGSEAASLISFIFAMPFLVHPLVFGMFGKAVSNDGKMPVRISAILAIIGLFGVIYSILIL